MNAPLSGARADVRAAHQPTEADRAFSRRVTDRLLRRAIAVNDADGDVDAMLAVLAGFRASYCREPIAKAATAVDQIADVLDGHH